MSIEWLRDLVIIIFGLVNIAVLIFFAILFYSLYRKMMTVQDSVIRVLSIVESAAALLKPLTQVATIIIGIWQGISSATNVFRNKGNKGSKKNG